MAFTLATRDVDQFRAAVTWFFQCELFGHNPDDPCDITLLQSLKFPGVSLVAYILLELFPVINFIYVINYRMLKKWCCKYLLRRDQSSSSSREQQQKQQYTNSNSLSLSTKLTNSIQPSIDPTLDQKCPV